MPLLATGFEAGSIAYYNAMGWIGGTIKTDTVHTSLSGHSGTYSVDPGAGSLYTPALDATQTRFLNFWAYHPTPSTGYLQVYFYRASTAQVSAKFDMTGTITLFLGTSTVLDSVKFNPNVPHWISLEVLSDNTTGVFTVWVDGVQVVTFSGDTQSHSTLTGWDQVRFLNTTSMRVDDMVITDVTEGRINEHFIVGLVPTSDDVVAMTPSVGINNFATVDEIPPSTADYNEGLVSGNQDTYGHGVLPWSPASIHSVGLNGYAARDGTITQGQLVMKSNVTTSLLPVTPHTLPASAGVYEVFQEHWTLDPDTAAAWSEAGVNASKIGIKFI
jgi:hypothetical protein